MEITNEIKLQYAAIWDSTNSSWFKQVAEYYLEVAAYLKGRNIKQRTTQLPSLLLRNSQKRLYLGIGCELLIKSFYLKNGYCINLFKDKFAGRKIPTHKLADINNQDINQYKTFTLDQLINHLPDVGINSPQIKRGFQIAREFRNKEGHITSRTHLFDDENYKDIQKTIVSFYDVGFGQTLDFCIAIKANDSAEFKITD
jgi:hypothetical protein